MLTVLAVLFAVSIVAPILYNWLGRTTFHVLAAALGAAFVWTLFYIPGVIAADQAAPIGAPNSPPAEVIEWIPELGVELLSLIHI